MKKWIYVLCFIILSSCTSNNKVVKAPDALYTGSISKIYFDDYLANMNYEKYEILKYDVDPYKLGKYRVTFKDAANEKQILTVNIVEESYCQVEYKDQVNLLQHCKINDTAIIIRNTVNPNQIGDYEIVYKLNEQIKKVVVAVLDTRAPILKLNGELIFPKNTEYRVYREALDDQLFINEDEEIVSRFFINTDCLQDCTADEFGNFDSGLRTVGDFDICYCVQDQGNNETCIYYDVKVVE